MAELYHRSWRAWRSRLKVMGWLRNRILRRISALHHARQPLRRTLANKTARCRRRERMSLPFWPFVGERSLYLIEGDASADIKPSFKDDTNIVPMPPRELASSNCEKVVERDVEVYRKEAQAI